MKNATTGKSRNSPKAFPKNTLRERLFQPVDIASIAIFRILFGAILFWEVCRYFSYGWVRSFYIDPEFYFKYFGFEWVHPWPGVGMYVHFALLGACALCVMAGFFYRIASWLLFLFIAFWFLLDQSHYLNHVYMIILVALQMAIIPAGRAISLDTLQQPKKYSNTIPAWCLWILQAQVGIVYFYGGIAKLNGDWLRGEPVRQWLVIRADYPLVGPWLNTEASVWIMSYGGLIFDLVVAPALLWRKTRLWAFAACLIFHITNSCLFNIGIFPFLMLAATLLFFPPDWPRKAFSFFRSPPDGSIPRPEKTAVSKRRKQLTVFIIASYFTMQLLFPLRHFLYPGNVHWTSEGLRFAWNMKVSSKRAEYRFLAVNPANKTAWVIDHLDYLTPGQSHIMSGMPDMYLQFAHFLGEKLEKEGQEGIEIHVQTEAILNDHGYQVLIDPKVDLSRTPRNLRHSNWIMPQARESKNPSE